MGRKFFTIVLFAVMMFIVGVTAASAEWVSLPSAEYISNAFSGFLPIVMSSDTPETEGPVGALIVFSTQAKTTGAGGGRVGMNAKCAAEDPKAHFCTLQEVHNAFLTSGVYFNTSTAEDSWIDNIDSTDVMIWNSYNCGGWTNEAAGGRIVRRKAEGPLTTTDCTRSLPIACCRWVP